MSGGGTRRKGEEAGRMEGREEKEGWVNGTVGGDVYKTPREKAPELRGNQLKS